MEGGERGERNLTPPLKPIGAIEGMKGKSTHKFLPNLMFHPQVCSSQSPSGWIAQRGGVPFLPPLILPRSTFLRAFVSTVTSEPIDRFSAVNMMSQMPFIQEWEDYCESKDEKDSSGATLNIFYKST